MTYIKVVVLLIVLFLMLSCQTGATSASLTVMTFNIRLNLPSDSVNAWPQRKEIATSMIKFYQPHIFGVQEALYGQVKDLEERLPAYNWIGIGRDDGKQQGEFMAIYYLKDRFELLDESTFWLSETPDRPGLGWDAAWNRVVTWGHFKDLKTGSTFYHFNTHLDNRGERARQEGAKLLRSRIQSIAGNEVVIVTGDFNAVPSSKPYEIMTKDSGERSVKLNDAKQRSLLPHHGPARTSNGFDLETLKTEAAPIDYIFIGNGIDVLKHATLSDTFDGYFPSDHMPVLAELRIQ